MLTGDSDRTFVVWPLSVGGHDGLVFKERGDIWTAGAGCGGSEPAVLPVRKRRTPFMTVPEEIHHHLSSAVVVENVGHVVHLPMATVLRPISRECDTDARLGSQQRKQAAGHRRQDRSSRTRDGFPGTPQRNFRNLSLQLLNTYSFSLRN